MFILMAIAEESGIDKKKFEELYNKYKNLMFYVSFNILKNKGDAEDAVQQAFINIIENFHKIDLENCNKTRNTFVLISKRTSINLYNSRKRKGTVDLEDDHYNNLKDESSEVAYNNIENEVEEAILALPDTYSDIIYFKYVLGYSNLEIAKLINITEGNVRQRINRGKEKLKEILIKRGVEIND